MSHMRITLYLTDDSYNKVSDCQMSYYLIMQKQHGLLAQDIAKKCTFTLQNDSSGVEAGLHE